MPQSGREPALPLPTHARPRRLRPQRDCSCAAETEPGRAAHHKILERFGLRVSLRDPVRVDLCSFDARSFFGAPPLLTPVEYRKMSHRAWMLLVVLGGAVFAADSYNGPRPQKPDVPYLLHADQLVETEVN